MSLTITIERTEGGLFRAEVGENPRRVIEHNDLARLVEELKRNLDMLGLAPDGRVLLIDSEICSEADEVAARAEVEKGALRHEELDTLIDRYPVPVEWGNEPGWSDAL